MATINPTLRALSVSVLVMVLGGCGGGGGGVEPIPIPPAPPPPPTTPQPIPPPPPSGSPFNTAEYQNSRAAAAANAIGAYETGATGEGVTAAIIDDSFASTIAPFAGRVHPASGDVVASRGLDGDHHHGTPVASILGAARDDSGIHGVAFDARLLMLRTDTPGTCTATSPTCQFNQADIAKAFDLAIQNGARVINLSMAFPINATFADAVDRATAAGIVVVISAGNDSASNPFSSAMVATSGNAHASVIIAGATNNAGTDLASFSNRAGAGADFYLAAVGEGLKVYNRNGVLVSGAYGTSFSAPAIAGAVALLADAFPNLTGQQIVQLLLTTADDAGAPGTDPIYGRGILNIARAFQPQGQSATAGSSVPVSTANNGQASGAMGDGTGKSQGAIILDGYSRAFAIDLARTLSRAPPQRPLSQALQPDLGTRWASADGTSVALTVRRSLTGQPWVGLAQAGLSYDDERRARAIAGMALTRLSPRTAAALGIAESARTLEQRLSGADGEAFLVARDPLARSGFDSAIGTSLGVRHDPGPVAVTVTSERGDVHQTGPRERIGEQRYSIVSASADRRIGPAWLSLGVSRLDERATVLGGRFSFAPAGSTSWFVDAGARIDVGRGWSVAGSYRYGFTLLPGGNGFVTGGRMGSDAFAFDLARANALARGDRLAFRVMQPLRVRGGGYGLSVPISYDYASGAVGFEARRMNLSPSGRELDFEGAWGVGVLGEAGRLTANAFLRRQPDHIRSAGDDVGAAIRFTLGF